MRDGEAQANAESEEEAKKKGAFLSQGANNAWKKRLGEYQAAVDKSSTTA